jgi:antitoxin YefM
MLDRVADLREHIIVTRRGHPEAVLISVDEYEGLEETAEILSDPGVVAAIDDGLREVACGETVTLAELRRVSIGLGGRRWPASSSPADLVARFCR